MELLSGPHGMPPAVRCRTECSMGQGSCWAHKRTRILFARLGIINEQSSHTKRLDPIRSVTVDVQFAGLLQDFINLLLVVGEVVHEVVPHLGIVLVDLVALHRPISDGEWPAGFEHECDCAFRDAHLWWWLCARCLELLVRNTVRHHAALEGHTTRLELIGTAGIFTVDETHELGSNVTVVVGWAVSVRGDVPTGGEDEEVSKRGGGVARGSGQNAEDGGVDVVDGDGTDVDELGEIVLVWNLKCLC